MTKNKPSILIVDDDPGITKTFYDILTFFGYDTKVTGTGERAMKLCSENTFDCAFVDIRMPGMNGLETMRKIREIIPGCEVVLMTAYAIVEIVEKAKKRDALGVIYKPVDPSRILRFLEKLKQKTSVMIVDDDDDFCEGLASALDHKGYLAKSAFNGSEAIDVVKDKRFDSIIIDMKLPDMNGLEVAEKVRSIDPAIDVALMTGFASMVPLMEERGRDTAQKMFLKPFELMELVSVLNRFRRMRLARIL